MAPSRPFRARRFTNPQTNEPAGWEVINTQTKFMHYYTGNKQHAEHAAKQLNNNPTWNIDQWINTREATP